MLPAKYRKMVLAAIPVVVLVIAGVSFVGCGAEGFLIDSGICPLLDDAEKMSEEIGGFDFSEDVAPPSASVISTALPQYNEDDAPLPQTPTPTIMPVGERYDE